jgi:glycosyltransferase involved in cell wall biosynthesis
MSKKSMNKDKAVLFQISIAAQFIQDCKWNIGYSVFETNRIPFSWVIPSNKMSAICVPCRQNKEAFTESGVTIPVHVVPHGVAEDLRPGAYQPLTMFADKKNFLFVGTPQYRKGIDLAISSYLQAFGDSSDTRLLCKVYLEAVQHENELTIVRDMIKDIRKKLNKHRGEIVVIPEYITDLQLRRLYASSEALIFASRGEGWGFAGSEAAGLGVPVIGTLWGGPADYLNPDVAYSVDYKLALVKNMQFNPQFMLAQMEGHMWAEPSSDSIVKAMKQVYSNPTEAKAKGLRAAQHMRNNFTWEKSGEALVDVIEKVVSQ